MLGFFHRPGEAFFVGAREQENLPDLTQVHADRVVDAFLLFEWDALLSELLVLSFFFLRRVGPGIDGSGATARAIEHGDRISEP